MPVTGPDLLPIDHPLGINQLSARLQARQIGSGVWLRKALNPDLLSRENLWQIPLLLFIAPVTNDRRADQAARHVVQPSRRSRARGFLGKNELLDNAGAFPAVLLRPRQPRVSTFVQSPIPLA